MSPRRLPLVLTLMAVALSAQGCLAVAAGGAVIGAAGTVVGTTGKAVVPGESKKDREKREFKAWKKQQRG